MVYLILSTKDSEDQSTLPEILKNYFSVLWTDIFNISELTQ